MSDAWLFVLLSASREADNRARMARSAHILALDLRDATPAHASREVRERRREVVELMAEDAMLAADACKAAHLALVLATPMTVDTLGGSDA